MFGLTPLPRSLRAALRDSKHQKLDVRLSAFSDLARLARSGEEEASEVLSHALEDASEAVRAAAALGLADAGVEQYLPQLLAAARSDVSSRVRQMALLAIGELAMPDHAEAVEALAAACRADDPAERFQALLGLHQLGAERAAQAITEGTVDPDPEVRRLSFRVAEAQWADSGVPEIVRARARIALSDSRESVRCAAALMLAHFGDMSGRQMVLSLAGGRVANASVEDEQAAIELLAALELNEARPVLERRAYSLLGRDPLAFHARVALARLGDERAVQSILRGLEAWTFDTRTLAVAAVGRAGLVEARPRIEALLDRPERADPGAVRETLALLDAAEAKGKVVAEQA